MKSGSIRLHIFMHQNFEVDKKQHVNRILYGIDHQYAFTKRYLKETDGNPTLRKELKLPKKSLDLCMPLAFNSKGSIFSANKLLPAANGTRPAEVRKFMTVFAKRVAATAAPASCLSCECSGDNSGNAYTSCTVCNAAVDPMMTNDMSSMTPKISDMEWNNNFDSDIDDMGDEDDLGDSRGMGDSADDYFYD